MYPELISRPDIKVFLPPIGGLTVYIFGNHELISDPKTRLTVRVHDECNGSDVFCSDICTCRPYLIFGMVEAIKEAQSGGVGLIIYCKFLLTVRHQNFELFSFCCPLDPSIRLNSNSIFFVDWENNNSPQGRSCLGGSHQIPRLQRSQKGGRLCRQVF